jgi:hypothetical protein
MHHVKIFQFSKYSVTRLFLFRTSFFKMHRIHFLILFLFAFNRTNAIPIVDTILPKGKTLALSPVTNFISKSFQITVDTNSLPFEYANAYGNQTKLKNITTKLQTAINTVLANGGGKVIIPNGKYFIDNNILIDPGYSSATSVTIIGSNVLIAPKKGPNGSLLCFLAKTFSKPVIHEVRFEGLSIDGMYYWGDTKSHFEKADKKPTEILSVIRIINYKYSHIVNCRIRNIYGQTIYINSDDSNRYKDSTIRASYVQIYNNNLYNCWGQRFYKTSDGVFDNYGDGINVSCAANGAVFNNIVYNNLYETGNYGRLGIGSDFQSSNIKFINNRVHGYDRNIHIENSRGGFLFANNKITGSEVGILIWPLNIFESPNRPLIIRKNYISNWGIPISFTSSRVMALYSGLINFLFDTRIHDNTLVEGNTIELDKNYDYTINPTRNPYGAILPIYCNQKYVTFKNNKIKGMAFSSGKKTAIISEFRNIRYKGNKLSNISVLPNHRVKSTITKQ